MGLTPLILAARRGSVPCVRLLLDAGADPNTRDLEGRNALDHAREMNHQEVVTVLQRTSDGQWDGADLAVLERFDASTRQATLTLLETLIGRGEHGEVDRGPTRYPTPEWYSLLRSSLPIAGLRFSCRPLHSPYLQDGRFLTVAEIEQAIADEPYLEEAFISCDFSPIAEGSDGNFFGVKRSGDSSAPVLLFDRSAMEARVAYFDLQQFFNALCRGDPKLD